MSRAEGLKEEIGWLRILFGIFVATDVSLTAGLVQNAGHVPSLRVLACVFAIIGVTFVIIRIGRTAYRKIDELEDL